MSERFTLHTNPLGVRAHASPTGNIDRNRLMELRKRAATKRIGVRGPWLVG